MISIKCDNVCGSCLKSEECALSRCKTVLHRGGACKNLCYNCRDLYNSDCVGVMDNHDDLICG
ncbi:MAG: hypothetical protein ACRCZ9_12245 [Fusobacteriaceae bacterium]